MGACLYLAHRNPAAWEDAAAFQPLRELLERALIAYDWGEAFAVTNLLEGHFPRLVDYQFTASMEDELDDIADGEASAVDFLTAFYFGGGIGEQSFELRGDTARAQIGQAEGQQVTGAAGQTQLQPGVGAEHGPPGAEVAGVRVAAFKTRLHCLPDGTSFAQARVNFLFERGQS